MIFSNMYNLNGFGSWNNMFSQGFGMLGGNGLSCGSFGGSIFSNCYGEVNFNKMAGFGVANALMNVGFMAASSMISKKEPKVDIEQKYNDTSEKIDEKISAYEDLRSNKKSLVSTINTANSMINDCKKELGDLNLEQLKAAYDTAISNHENDNSSENKIALDAAKKAYDDALQKQAEINKKIENYETKIKEANEELDEINDEMVVLSKEIRALKYKQNSYAEVVEENKNDKILDKADGNWLQRKLGGENGDLRTSLRKYRKLKQEYDQNPNEETAKLLYNLGKNSLPQYEKLSDGDKKSFSSAIGIIKKTQGDLLRKYPNIES